VTDYIPARLLAKKLGVATSTLAKWRWSDPPKGPQGWKHLSGTCVVYPADEVEKWLATR
jgi:hypothetical protein